MPAIRVQQNDYYTIGPALDAGVNVVPMVNSPRGSRGGHARSTTLGGRLAPLAPST